MTAPLSRETAIQQRLDAATPGPWVWRNSSEPMLLGVRSLLVMGFRRFGMNGAQPEFRNSQNLMEPAGKANINAYPDADLIANAPSDLAYLLAENADKQARIDEALALAESLDRANGYEPSATRKNIAAQIRAALTNEGDK